ncbi:Uncharacterised protein [[Eubacterium] contortum]|uniref:Uncharacterized protein n=1 Tax=Faecalicatena contorta TaxID=39482 RepID=A0A174AJH3_9FIRM|nr:hypothetical protein [Faecalicatena contorta]CUN87596.1 Uncharacterised protein [[Eubacterium] contortum] [Faecalicatena contorta]
MKSEIVEYYESCGSIRQTRKAFSMSCQKVRKILITEGAFESDTSRAVNDLYSKGLSIDDISRKLKLTKTCVNSYLPYTKGVYNSDAPTKNAKILREWRRSKKEGEKNE